jgi:hypothetical protein
MPVSVFESEQSSFGDLELVIGEGTAILQLGSLKLADEVLPAERTRTPAKARRPRLDRSTLCAAPTR